MMNQRGFSLVELIIVIAILAMLTGITLPLLQTGFNSYFTQRDLSDADWQGRLALSRMARDMRDLATTSNISTATSTQFSFTDNTNTAVSYTLSGTTLQRNGLTLANGVSAMTFSYEDRMGAVAGTVAAIRYVSITLNITQNNTNFTLQSVVDLRNIVS